MDCAAEREEAREGREAAAVGRESRVGLHETRADGVREGDAQLVTVQRDRRGERRLTLAEPIRREQRRRALEEGLRGAYDDDEGGTTDLT